MDTWCAEYSAARGLSTTCASMVYGLQTIRCNEMPRSQMCLYGAVQHLGRTQPSLHTINSVQVTQLSRLPSANYIWRPWASKTALADLSGGEMGHRPPSPWRNRLFFTCIWPFCSLKSVWASIFRPPQPICPSRNLAQAPPQALGVYMLYSHAPTELFAAS
jgi:hypothetical protein